MADMALLQQKYEPALKAIDRFSPEGAQLQDVSLAGDKLYVKATLPSQVALNFVWEEIKKVDPAYADLQCEIVNTGGQEQEYVVKAGDMLSKIADHFYGDGNLSGEIAKANGIADGGQLQAGTRITIPIRS